LQRLVLATSNLMSSWSLPKLTIKSHAEERVGVASGFVDPQHLGFLFNIYTEAKASDFKFGTQFRFAKAHHKITPIGKMGMNLG